MRSRLRPARTRLRPVAARCFALSSPRPECPPVIRTVGICFPFSEMSSDREIFEPRLLAELAILLLVGISSTHLHALPDPRVDLSRLDQDVSNLCARYGSPKRHGLKSCLLDAIVPRRTVSEPCMSRNHPLRFLSH